MTGRPIGATPPRTLLRTSNAKAAVAVTGAGLETTEVGAPPTVAANVAVFVATVLFGVDPVGNLTVIVSSSVDPAARPTAPAPRSLVNAHDTVRVASTYVVVAPTIGVM